MGNISGAFLKSLNYGGYCLERSIMLIDNGLASPDITSCDNPIYYNRPTYDNRRIEEILVQSLGTFAQTDDGSFSKIRILASDENSSPSNNGNRVVDENAIRMILYLKECNRIKDILSKKDSFPEKENLELLLDQLFMLLATTWDISDYGDKAHEIIADSLFSIVINYDKMAEECVGLDKVICVLTFFFDNNSVGQERKKELAEKLSKWQFDNEQYKTNILLALSKIKKLDNEIKNIVSEAVLKFW